jgi:Family of unknown function (DUF5681)
MAENSAAKQPGRGSGRPFRPGQSGNPAGKPKGTRHRATILAEQLLDGEAEKLTRKAVELALAGDMAALRLCLDRIISPRRDRPVSFDMPELATANDAEKTMGKIAAAVASGELTPSEAAALSGVIETFLKTAELAEIERRLQLLEERRPPGSAQ